MHLAKGMEEHFGGWGRETAVFVHVEEAKGSQSLKNGGRPGRFTVYQRELAKTGCVVGKKRDGECEIAQDLGSKDIKGEVGQVWHLSSQCPRKFLKLSKFRLHDDFF